MIPRLLVPLGSKPPAEDATSQRRRPSTLDERTLVPSTLPIIPLNGHSNIPSSLPLDSISARVVVPRDVKAENFVPEEKGHLPAQPTDLDFRIAIPQGAAPPEIIQPSENPVLPTDIVEPDVFMTGEVNLLTKPQTKEHNREELVRSISSVAFHILLIVLILIEPKVFPAHVRTREDDDLAQRQMRVFLPQSALEEPKTAPPVKAPPVKVDPKVLRKVAPEQPKIETPPPPTPPPTKTPDPTTKELPSAPTPHADSPSPPKVETPQPKLETPKAQPKLETPDDPKPNNLKLPNLSSNHSIQDSMRDLGSKMDAPPMIVGGGTLPGTHGGPGAGGQGQAVGGLQLLENDPDHILDEYVRRVLYRVKLNWYAVMPESVYLGDKGIVVLRFRIKRDGTVPTDEPNRLRSSGKEPLDRAAVSSIRASNPFESLPVEWNQDYITLQFTYFYNLRPQDYGFN
jgi:hypothetical protein